MNRRWKTIAPHGFSPSRFANGTIRKCGYFRQSSREVLASLLAAAVREAYPSAPLSERATQIAAEVTAVGYSKLLAAMPAERAADVVRYFEAIPCLNKHVELIDSDDGIRRDPRGDARQFSFGTYTQSEIFAAPHLLETVTAPPVLDAVEAFLGARPMLFSLNAYWSFPQPGAPSYGQDFHRDISHPKFCVLFLYLTDTDSSRGAHQYIRGTPSPAALAAMLRSLGIDCDERQFFGLERDGLGFTELYERYLSPLMETISGPAGTMFLEDPYGLHRGPVPLTAPRFMAWARYSVFPEPPTLQKRTERAILGPRYPADERARYALRPLIAP